MAYKNIVSLNFVEAKLWSKKYSTIEQKHSIDSYYIKNIRSVFYKAKMRVSFHKKRKVQRVTNAGEGIRTLEST